MVNGFLINSGVYFPGGLSFGEVTRIFFLLLLLVSLKLGKSKNDYVFIAVPYLLIVLSLIQYIFLDNDLVSNLNISTKLSLPVLLYIFIKNNLHHKYTAISKIIYINSVVLLLNLYLSFFGIGFSNYSISATDISIGGTGFFYAGNEVAGALLALYAIILFKFSNNIIASISYTFAFLIASFALMSKASILGVVGLFVIYLFIYKPFSYTKITAIATIVLFVLYDFILETLSPALNRWTYFIGEYGALTYLTGGIKRWEMAGSIFTHIIDYPLLILTGSGWSGLAEQNFVDLLEGFGLVGILVFGIWIYWGVNVLQGLRNRSDQFYSFSAFFLLIAVAVLAGHIIQSAMIAPFIAILANLYTFSHSKMLIPIYSRNQIK